MSLYLALAIAVVVGIFFRLRYGADAMRYAGAALFLILFLYCPSGFYPGVEGLAGGRLLTVGDQVGRLGEVVSFALLFLAAWIGGTSNRKESP